MSVDKKESNLKWFIEKILIPLLVALIAAYAGLVAAKVLPWPFPTSPTATPTPIASPVAPALQPPTAMQIVIANPPSQPTAIPFPDDLAGVWSGTGSDIVNGTSDDTRSAVTISTPCKSGNICGQGFVPTVKCSFNLTYLREDGGKFFFDEGNYIGYCGISRIDYLQLLSNGKLLFHSEGNFGVSDVIMTR